jgi:surfeit locus 1 family protein
MLQVLKKLAIPTLFVILAGPVLMSLGQWQLARLAWKTELINQRRQAFQRPPSLGLHAVPNPIVPGQRLLLHGQWRHDYETYIQARMHAGKAGIYVVTPIQTAEGTILVNRGWVPGLHTPEINFPRPSGLVTIEAVVLPVEIPSRWLTAGKGFTYIDPKHIISSLKDARLDCYGQELSSRTDPPLTLSQLPEYTNRHLEYALTWFIFTAILLVIYGVYMIQILRQHLTKGRT